MTAKGFHPLVAGSLIEVALPGVKVQKATRSNRTLEKALVDWFKTEPDEFMEMLKKAEIPPAEEAAAYSALLNPSHPEARLFAIETLAALLLAEMKKLVAEIAENEREPAESVALDSSRAGLGDGSRSESGDEVYIPGRGPELESSETLKKLQEEGNARWRRER